MLMGRGIGRVGRPGLIGTAARTAVVAGTATAVVGGMSRHQQNKQAEQQEAAAYEQQAMYQQVPRGGTSDNDRISQLERLAKLHTQGVLNDAEFAAEKAKLL